MGSTLKAVGSPPPPPSTPTAFSVEPIAQESNERGGSSTGGLGNRPHRPLRVLYSASLRCRSVIPEALASSRA